VVGREGSKGDEDALRVSGEKNNTNVENRCLRDHLTVLKGGGKVARKARRGGRGGEGVERGQMSAFARQRCDGREEGFGLKSKTTGGTDGSLCLRLLGRLKVKGQSGKGRGQAKARKQAEPDCDIKAGGGAPERTGISKKGGVGIGGGRASNSALILIAR